MYFEYGEKETEYLSSKDKKLKNIIERTGQVNRELDGDLFTALVHHITAQQISNKALATVWGRMQELLGDITPENIAGVSDEQLQSCGITFKKVSYIKDLSEKILDGEFDLEAVNNMTDKEAIKYLSALKGIGVWTAEMILLFCLQRPDILSYDDLAIQKGMRMVYHHKKIDKKLFEKYRKRFSPYGSVASLYFWAVAGGALPDIKER